MIVGWCLSQVLLKSQVGRWIHTSLQGRLMIVVKTSVDTAGHCMNLRCCCYQLSLLLQTARCHFCKSSKDISSIKVPYACKLLFQELQAMNVVPRIALSNYADWPTLDWLWPTVDWLGFDPKIYNNMPMFGFSLHLFQLAPVGFWTVLSVLCCHGDCLMYCLFYKWLLGMENNTLIKKFRPVADMVKNVFQFPPPLQAMILDRRNQ